MRAHWPGSSGLILKSSIFKIPDQKNTWMFLKIWPKWRERVETTGVGLVILCAFADESFAFKVLQGMCWSDGKVKMEMRTGTWKHLLIELKRQFPITVFPRLTSLDLWWLCESDLPLYKDFSCAALLKLNKINTVSYYLPWKSELCSPTRNGNPFYY